MISKFTCASYSSSYIDKTCCYFKTRIQEHVKKDNISDIFKHLHSTATCFNSYNSLCFNTIDKANSKFDLKIKEAFHINWRKLDLNAQQNHLGLTLSLQLLSPFALFCLCLFNWFFLFLRFSFLLFSISLTLIIGIFYSLNYTSLLRHFITTLFVSHLSLSSIVFFISTPISASFTVLITLHYYFTSL